MMKNRKDRNFENKEANDSYNHSNRGDEKRQQNSISYESFEFQNYLPNNHNFRTNNSDYSFNLSRKRSRSRSHSPTQIHPESDLDLDSSTPTAKSTAAYNKYLNLEKNIKSRPPSPFPNFNSFKPRSPTTVFPEEEEEEAVEIDQLLMDPKFRLSFSPKSGKRSPKVAPVSTVSEEINPQTIIKSRIRSSPKSGKWSPKVAPLSSGYEDDTNNSLTQRSPRFLQESPRSTKHLSTEAKFIDKYRRLHSSHSLMVDHQKLEDLKYLDEEAQQVRNSKKHQPVLEKAIQSLFESINQSISLFWVEKLILFIDMVQIFSLIWNISLRWPWSFIWLNFTWGLNLFNLDFFSLSFDTPRGGIIPSLPNYTIYAIIMMPVPFLIIMLYETIGYLNTHYLDGYFSLKGVSYFKMVCIWLLYFLFLPYALFQSRIVFCNVRIYSNLNSALNLNVMTYDESTLCHSFEHLLAITIGIPGVLIYGLYFLFTLRRLINPLCIYHHPTDHEIYIQRKEIEYLTKLSMDWNYSMYWIISSFTLEGYKFWFFSFAMKVLLAILLLCPMNTISNSIQIVLFSAIIFFWVSYGTLVNCFRCTSSNAFFQFFYWSLYIVSIFAMLSGTETQIALTVGTRQTIFLITFCSIGIFLTLVSTCVLIWRPYLDVWPTQKTFLQLYNDFQCVEAIDAMQETNDLIVEMHTVPEMLAPVNELEDQMSKLHEIYIIIRKKGSILENTLRSQLDILARLHKQFRKVSIMPGEDNKIKELLSTKAEIIQNRSRVRILMNPKKRNFLFKILAMRLWIGERNIPMTNNLENALRIDNRVPNENNLAWKQIVLIGSDSAYFSVEEKEEQKRATNSFEHFPFLFAKTEALLEDASSKTIKDIKLVKQCWKKIIRSWEKDFEETEGFKPTLEDKEVKRNWYDNYHALSLKIKAIE